MKFMKFLIYKLYRFAITQDTSAGIVFSFLIFISIFELLHLLLIGLFFKVVTGYEIQILGVIEKIFGFLFVGVGCILNYYLFIKTNKIYEINKYFESKNVSTLRGNIIFFGYSLFLFFLMFLLAIYYQKRH
jgi:hypothetical protein